MVVKGRNRDTAWFSITNDEWTDLENVFTEWLESAVQNRHQRLRKMVNEIKERK
jgi:hypothetical protein